MRQGRDECEGGVHFSQMGALQDPSLLQLREHVKQVMIPLLIKTFHHQQIGQQAYDQLKLLDQDLEHLEHWICQCRSQVGKALEKSDTTCRPLTAQSMDSKPASSWWRSLFTWK